MTEDDDRRWTFWNSGRDAALAGKDVNSCPLPRGTIYFDDWHDGFEAGLNFT